MNDLVESTKITGDICLDGTDIYKNMDAIELRRRVGMVFQQPNPFPKSIYDNIAYGPRIFGIKKKSELDEIVERSLRQAAIWDEVKDRLHVRRSAAKALHRPGPGCQAGSIVDGRTYKCSRSNFN